MLGIWRLATAMLLLNAASSSALDWLEEYQERTAKERNSNDIRSLIHANDVGLTYNGYAASLLSKDNSGEPILYADNNGFMQGLFRTPEKEGETVDSAETSKSATQDTSHAREGTLSEKKHEGIPGSSSPLTTKGAEKSTRSPKTTKKSIRGSVGIVKSNGRANSFDDILGNLGLSPLTGNQVIVPMPPSSPLDFPGLSLLGDFAKGKGKGSKLFKKSSKKTKTGKEKESKGKGKGKGKGKSKSSKTSKKTKTGSKRSKAKSPSQPPSSSPSPSPKPSSTPMPSLTSSPTFLPSAQPSSVPSSATPASSFPTTSQFPSPQLSTLSPSPSGLPSFSPTPTSSTARPEIRRIVPNMLMAFVDAQRTTEPAPADYEQLATVTMLWFEANIAFSLAEGVTLDRSEYTIQSNEFNAGYPEPRYNILIDYGIVQFVFSQSSDAVDAVPPTAAEIDLILRSSITEDYIRNIVWGVEAFRGNITEAYYESVNNTFEPLPEEELSEFPELSIRMIQPGPDLP